VVFILNSKRGLSKGFTLVELLITVIIIGILAGSLVVGFGQMRAKTTATRIISDMRTMRSALTLYYLDKGTWPIAGDWDAVKDYIDSDALSSKDPASVDQQKIYAIRVFSETSQVATRGRMFVVANVNDNRKFGIDASVRLKLAERQAEYGLYNNGGINAYTSGNTTVMIEVKK
jgi:prepilin-type N-terminal cleavage/methylation domain-containing protein